MSYRFYAPPERISDDSISLSEEEEHHAVDILRLKKNTQVDVFDGSGNIYKAKIIKTNPIILNIIKKEVFTPKTKLTVCVGLAKSKKIDLVIRQLTEIGVFKINVFNAKRSVPSFNTGKIENRINRWKKIAIEATKQSKREYVPLIRFLNWQELKETLSLPIFVLYEEEKKQYLKDCIKADNLEGCTLIIGPEGGLEKKEVEELKEKGGKICSIGKYILRVETASIYAAAVVANEMSIANYKE